MASDKFINMALKAALEMDNVNSIKETIRDVLAAIEPKPVVGKGEPPVKGAVPALTYRDKDGNLQIQLCRTYGGEGWRYTPVADGWVTITREE